MAEINIVITLDNNYIQHAAVMLHSLIQHNRRNKIHIFAICDDRITDELWNKLALVYNNTNVTVEKINIDPARFADFTLTNHATAANYYRIEMAELLPKSIDKVLYLDVDIVVMKDLLPLYNLDIGNAYIGAVEDPTSPLKSVIGFSDAEPYFNSGIMVINLVEWRKVDLLAQLRHWIINNPSIINYWDQDALNVVCKNHWEPLHPKYNVQTPLYNFDKDGITYTLAEIEEAVADPFIIHYTGKTKPWEYMNEHPMKSDYYRHLKRTPWKNYKAEDDTFANSLRKYKLMPAFVEKIIQKRK